MAVAETALRRRGQGLVMSLDYCSENKAVYFSHCRCLLIMGVVSDGNLLSENYWVNKVFK